MTDVKAMRQKINGQVTQLKGEVNQQQGKGVKGGLQKISGKLDEVIADAKLKIDESKHEEKNHKSDW